MPELTFLPATDEDVSAIYDLCKDLVNRYEDPASMDIDRVLLWILDKIQSNIAKYTCVREAGEKVAYYCLAESNDGWELDDLYVLAQHRNRGIGSEILERCISEASASIFLYVFTGNAGAIRLYERHGFSCVQQVSKTRQIMRRDG